MECYTLKQWRRLRGMTQEELAYKAGLTTRTISNYEDSNEKFGKASYATVQRLADILNIKLSQFFLGDTSEKPNSEKQEV